MKYVLCRGSRIWATIDRDRQQFFIQMQRRSRGLYKHTHLNSSVNLFYWTGALGEGLNIFSLRLPEE
ncbi:hypothetical protein [Aerosakkonema sp. BLCC-F183]|uniref:hypothetical protein n=1 Tax=Aerosakkonema sp. BLCC-F183 TaxID=3342834 RepID=UPI0035BBFAAD